MELDIFEFIQIWYNQKKAFRITKQLKNLETENNFENLLKNKGLFAYQPLF
jgi:hypothetical protein